MFFFVGFVFAYFYLRSLNNGGMWHPRHVAPSLVLGTLFTACVVGSAGAARLADYRYLLTTAKRVLIDSATAPAGAIGFPWPRPENVRDLAFARLLPVRQMIGQFLSRYPVGSLSGDLRSITLAHGAEVSCEARVLLSWARDRIRACGAAGETFDLVPSADLPARAFALTFAYGDRRFFACRADLASAHATLDADFGSGRTTMPASVALLSQESALSEAMFF